MYGAIELNVLGPYNCAYKIPINIAYDVTGNVQINVYRVFFQT